MAHELFWPSYVFAVVHLISFDEGDNGGTGAEDDATDSMPTGQLSRMTNPRKALAAYKRGRRRQKAGST